MREVKVPPVSIDRFTQLLGPAPVEALRQEAAALRSGLGNHAIWNINSTPRGGGVAELLRGLVGYGRAENIDVRWGVISGSLEFFRLTKRLHNFIHGNSQDGSQLDDSSRLLYEQTLKENAIWLGQLLRSGDVVVLHDPQTAGLASALKKLGARVVWRCHIGSDVPNPQSDLGWRFLAPYLKDVDGFVFSRSAYVPWFIDRSRAAIISPTIDPFSPKNQQLEEDVVRAILVHTGLIEGPKGPGTPVFQRGDGSPGRVDHCADVLSLGRAVKFEIPLVIQVSRWDRLKDPVGVLRGFARLLEPTAPGGAHLLLAGPTVHAVADDPEGADVFGEVQTAWRALPHHHRRFIHLANLPMADVEENAAIVNALQRHAAVVVQKSLREGFGLTVAEAMWKGRPVLASAVGGIQDQIEDGVDGVLLRDPTDEQVFAQALRELLLDPERAVRLGRAAHARVKNHFLGLHSLAEFAHLIQRICAS